MRRLFALAGFILPLVVLGAVLVSAEQPTTTIPVTPPPATPDTQNPPKLIPDLNAIVLANPASDACNAASELILNEDDIVEGAITDVSDFTTAASDPALTCWYGTPPRDEGYRTAWHRFVAPVDGTLTVRTKTNTDYKRNYDTAVAIYRDASAGACTTLTLVGCNDDSYGILSEAIASVEQGETYVIEIVDRNLAAPGQVLLNVEAIFTPAGTWEPTGNTQLPVGLTRHSVVISDSVAFIMGGESTLNPRNGTFYRFDTDTQSLTTLADFPAGLTPNGSGYANTDAVLVRDEIHLPTGGVGGTSYDGTHWVYDISDNAWSTISSPALTWSTIPVTASATTFGTPAYSVFLPYSSGSQEGFYLLGGLVGKFLGDPAADEVHPSNTVYRYVDNGATQNWQPLNRMNKARYAHTGATIGNLACVVGGLTTTGSSNQLITDGECYNPGSATWQNNVGALNTPRYMAESGVGPDGNWYVFGGLDASGQAVATVEVHDFNTATWTELDAQFNVDSPALAWPRGGFVGARMWLFGGEQQNGVPISLIQTKSFQGVGNFTPTSAIYLPLFFNEDRQADTPNVATRIPVNQSRVDNFSGIGDVYNMYTFDWTGGTAEISVINIPAGGDYDILLYDSDKTLLAVSQTTGSQPEVLTRSLSSGSYFILVARSSPPPSFPPGSPFTLGLFER